MTSPAASVAPLHVVAGVLFDAAGRVLLAQRPHGREHGGLWEFPGGKCEPGELPAAALARELHEELGIAVAASTPLIAVPQSAPRPLLLDVMTIRQWQGEVHGREGQALRWVPPDQLSRWPMPPADRPVAAALNQPAHYAITPEPDVDAASFVAAIDRQLEGGIRRLQLRSKQLPRAALHALVRDVWPRVQSTGAELLVNADLELAATLGCGVHLTSAQLGALEARPLPTSQPVAASCHDVDDLRHAEALGLDFVVLGPVLPTASHPGADVLGWQRFAALRATTCMPVYALGGLGPDHVASARRHGAQGIAAIRGLWPTLAGSASAD